jgi:hypothetical protein
MQTNALLAWRRFYDAKNGCYKVPDGVKTRVRRPGRKKRVRQGDFFALGKRPFCTQEHQVYTRPIQQGDKVESESNKEGQSELKEEI